MTPQEIQNKLEAMKGKSFTYADQTHLVASYKVNGSDKTFELKTNLKTFKRHFTDAESFFPRFIEIIKTAVVEKKEITEEPVVTVKQSDLDYATEEKSQALVPIDVIKGDNLADELVKILRENIHKVKTSPAFIPQASAISQSVTQIINIERLRLDMHKQLNGTKKPKSDSEK